MKLRGRTISPSRRAWILGALGGAVIGWIVVQAALPKAILPSSADETDPRELYAVVENQISAIQRDDFSTAYGFAASGIQKKFPVAAFREMVQKTYPQLTSSRRLNFGQARFAADIHASALIYVNTGNGDASPMIYAFVKEGGAWKIEGVQMLQSERFDLSGPET